MIDGVNNLQEVDRFEDLKNDLVHQGYEGIFKVCYFEIMELLMKVNLMEGLMLKAVCRVVLEGRVMGVPYFGGPKSKQIFLTISHHGKLRRVERLICCAC